ncbi:MAG: hypothetical protein ACI9LM_005343 [Alteromonadaceae bacterium]|jgi:hypothetical protein
MKLVIFFLCSLSYLLIITGCSSYNTAVTKSYTLKDSNSSPSTVAIKYYNAKRDGNIKKMRYLASENWLSTLSVIDELDSNISSTIWSYAMKMLEKVYVGESLINENIAVVRLHYTKNKKGIYRDIKLIKVNSSWKVEGERIGSNTADDQMFITIFDQKIEINKQIFLTNKEILLVINNKTLKKHDCSLYINNNIQYSFMANPLVENTAILHHILTLNEYDVACKALNSPIKTTSFLVNNHSLLD